MPIIDLIEETDVHIGRRELDVKTALRIHNDKRFSLDFPSPVNQDSYVIRSNGWVGHIPFGSDTVLRVRPKLPVTRLFELLETAYDLQSFRVFDGETNIDSIDGLFERLAAILARQVLDRARRGIYQEYVSRQEELSFVRGRLDVRAMARRGPTAAARPVCEFEELTPDIEDNQILLWTLTSVARRGVTRQDVQRDVGRACRVLAGAVTCEPKSAANCIRRFYNRLNDDYQPLHGICRLLLEHLGPDLANGAHDFLPFALNMPRLFESFVAEWLKRNSPPGWTVRAQHTAKLQSTMELLFRMDIVIRDRESGRPLAVLDTKYKSAEAPTETDVQQMIAYAHELGADRAFLVYPSKVSQSVIAQTGQKHKIWVETLVFDLADNPPNAGTNFLARLMERTKNSPAP